MERSAARSAVGLAVALLGACAPGGTDWTDARAPEPSTGFVFQTVLDTPDGRTSYVGWLRDLDVDVLDLADTLEVPGNGRVYVEGGRAWSGSGEAPEILPLRLGDGVVPVPELTVSLAATGLPASPFGHVFLAGGELALFGDEITLLDPLGMRLTGSASLDAARVGGRLPDAGVGVRQGDRVLVPVTYKAFPNVDDAVHVLVLDAQTGAARGVWSDARCHGTGTVERAPDGTVYVTGTNGYVLPRFGDPTVPSTCVLRIPPGGTGFDPAWHLDLREATGGLDATGVRVLDDTTAVAFVFDPSRAPPEAEDDPEQLYTSASSRWWWLDLETGDAAPIDGLPWVPSGSGIASPLGDRSALLALPEAWPAEQNRFVRVWADRTAEDAFGFSGRGVVWPLR